jgi:hypothetical protein
MSVGFREFDVEKKRERLRKLSDEELAREMVSSAIPMPPRIKLMEVALRMRTRRGACPYSCTVKRTGWM